MLYLLCLQCYCCTFKSAAFRSVIILVPAVNACSPLLFLRVRAVDELQSCSPSPDEIKLGNCLSFPLQACIPCWARRVMSWAVPSKADPEQCQAWAQVPVWQSAGHWLARTAYPKPPSLSWFHWLPHQIGREWEGMSDLSAASLEGSLSIYDLDKFLGHIRFVLGLGIILSKFHNGRQLKEHTHGKQSGKTVFPWSRHVFLELGCHSHTPLLSLLRVQSILVLEELQRCLLLLWKLGLYNKYAFPSKLTVCQLLPRFPCSVWEESQGNS